MNNFLVTGILGDDPIQKNLREGSVTKFNIRNTEPFTMPDGETRETITWFNCEAWKKIGSSAMQDLRKDDQVLITGKFVVENWIEGKEKKIRYLVKVLKYEKL